MSLAGALIGGILGTAVLTSIMRAASAARVTRIDIPFLIGTAVTADRARAKAAGYAMHLVAGLGFALMYYAVFVVIGEASWWLGVLLGLVHAVFAGTILVNILLPLVHPRMGSNMSAADSTSLLEPAGFMLLNYGLPTPLVAVFAHAIYGAIVGGVIAAS